MADYVDRGLKRVGITISTPMLAIVCITFGIIVILFPNLLVWMVGLFLIIQGALLLTDYLEHERRRATVTVSKGVYCSSCGTRNAKESVYCRRCGKKLEQAKQIATPQPKEVMEQHFESKSIEQVRG
ncbi:MAG: zinc-ribbon domain-containing protein [Candidatus Bathyarchaeia archaeon]